MEMWAHLDPTGDPIGSATRSRAILDGWISDAWNDLPKKKLTKGDTLFQIIRKRFSELTKDRS